MDLNKMVGEAKKVLIAGHIRPDGDCVGACIAASEYLKKKDPSREITVYFSVFPENFSFLRKDNDMITNDIPNGEFDVFVSLDCSTTDRLGDVEPIFYKTPMTICIDHHVSNKGFAKQNIIEPDASSACEVLFGCMEEEAIDYDIASALYIGIIFDSGVFRYDSTSRKTMEIAGKLMEKGIPFGKYIDECFYQKTYIQTQLLGRTLLTSMRVMDGKCVVASITQNMMRFYGAKTEDIDGIIDQLRLTKGVEVAILLHETSDQQFKVSMRSNSDIDVSRIAVYFGGGGHVKAAGVTMHGSLHDVINNITEHIEKQMIELEEKNKQ